MVDGSGVLEVEGAGAKIPTGLVSQLQVEEIVFYSVHNPAPSTL